LRALTPGFAWTLIAASTLSCATGTPAFIDTSDAAPAVEPLSDAGSGTTPANGSHEHDAGGGAFDGGGEKADAYGGPTDDASAGGPIDAGGPDWFTLPTLDASTPSSGDASAGTDGAPAHCATQICFDGFDCLFAGCGTTCTALHCN
jgi:hypothetical protein